MNIASVRAFLASYTPNITDKADWDAVTFRSKEIDAEMTRLKVVYDHNQEQKIVAREKQRQIDQSTLDISGLLPRDQVLFSSIQVHALTFQGGSPSNNKSQA